MGFDVEIKLSKGIRKTTRGFKSQEDAETWVGTTAADDRSD